MDTHDDYPVFTGESIGCETQPMKPERRDALPTCITVMASSRFVSTKSLLLLYSTVKQKSSIIFLYVNHLDFLKILIIRCSKSYVTFNYNEKYMFLQLLKIYLLNRERKVKYIRVFYELTYSIKGLHY